MVRFAEAAIEPADCATRALPATRHASETQTLMRSASPQPTANSTLTPVQRVSTTPRADANRANAAAPPTETPVFGHQSAQRAASSEAHALTVILAPTTSPSLDIALDIGPAGGAPSNDGQTGEPAGILSLSVALPAPFAKCPHRLAARRSVLQQSERDPCQRHPFSCTTAVDPTCNNVPRVHASHVVAYGHVTLSGRGLGRLTASFTSLFALAGIICVSGIPLQSSRGNNEDCRRVLTSSCAEERPR